MNTGRRKKEGVILKYTQSILYLFVKLALRGNSARDPLNGVLSETRQPGKKKTVHYSLL